MSLHTIDGGQSVLTVTTSVVTFFTSIQLGLHDQYQLERSAPNTLELQFILSSGDISSIELNIQAAMLS